MKNRIRRWLAVGAVAAATTLGASALAVADTAPVDNSSAPYAVEDFSYPGTAPFKNVKLISGDGHITLADCAGDTQIQVQSALISAQIDGPIGAQGKVCFAVSGTSGYLAVEIPEVYYIQALQRSIRASLTPDGGATQTVDVAKGKAVSVGEATGGAHTTLVELRVTG